ncbi:MAG: hypothetical protein QM711_11625 [Micropruina sp.]|uniref:hypothetical protein n=1 Tax=Micropruina sp. TaxID=2737536 RepID=UPI0039E63C2B
MTDHPPVHDDLPNPPAAPTADGGGSTTGLDRPSFGSESPTATDAAKQEASRVASTAADAAGEVVAVARDSAANLAAETKEQAKSLLSSAGDELKSQGAAQQQRVAAGVRSLVDELAAMVGSSDGSGPLTDLARQAADKGRDLAQWLEDHEPQDVLGEVQAFARRRPVAFLAICGLAGVIAGRITRGAAAARSGDSASHPGASAAGPGPASGSGYRTERPVDPCSDPAAFTAEQSATYGSDAGSSGAFPQGAARTSESLDEWR